MPVQDGGQALSQALKMGLIPLESLHGSFLTYDESTAKKVYAQSRSAAAFLVERYGLFRVKLLLEKLSTASTFSGPFEEVLLISYADFEKEWRRKLADEPPG